MSELPEGEDMDNRVSEPAHISRGWSITVGELKRAIADIPDDYEVMLENAEVDDIDISNVNINKLMPPSVTGSPGLLILGGGQILNSEYDYHNRLDAHHMLGGDKHWRGPDHPRANEGKGWVAW
jgi:hypothetical protein